MLWLSICEVVNQVGDWPCHIWSYGH